ncbi:MAG: hypothetical protein NVS3B19_17550 [Ginsengibacter sp.]
MICACFALSKVNAQSSPDSKTLSSVVQAIIGLPELQKYYPLEADNTVKQLNIVQFPFSFPDDLAVSKGNSPVKLITVAEQAGLNPDAYFMFRNVANSPSGIKAVLNYFYKNGGAEYKILSLTVDLQQANNSWSITNYTLNGDKL